MSNTYKRETFVRGSAFELIATLKDGDGELLTLDPLDVAAQVNIGPIGNPTKLVDLSVAALSPPEAGKLLLSTAADTSTWPLGEIRVGLKAVIGTKPYLTTEKSFHVTAGGVWIEEEAGP